MNTRHLRVLGLSSLLLSSLMIGSGSGSEVTAAPWTEDEQKTELLVIKVAREMERGDYALLSVDELQQRLQAGEDLLIVDTMPYRASYQKAHIPGALQLELPIEELQELSDPMQAELQELLGEDQDRPVVFYCGFTECGRSHNGAMWARRLGYTQVYRVPGGIRAWQDAGHPVASLD